MHKHKPTFAPIHMLLAVLIGVVLLINTIQILGINSLLSGEEPAKPSLQATLIEADCEDCSDLSEYYEALMAATQYDVDGQKLPATDEHAKTLMKKHSITKLPALVIEGDIEKVTLEGTVKSDDALVLMAAAPYYDVMSGTVKGKVSITHVAPVNCPDCSNTTALGAQLQQLGVIITSEKTFKADSADGKRLIAQYNLSKLPAVILSPDAGEYAVLAEVWPQVGDTAPDGSLVTRNVQPPYYDLVKKTVRGRLNFIGLEDKTCADCYNVSVHKDIFLGNFGAKFVTENTYDISSVEGKKLLAQYNITKVPTVIVIGDPAAYESLVAVWSQVGTVEKDGAYVFRNLDVLQGLTYKDLKTGETVKAATA